MITLTTREASLRPLSRYRNVYEVGDTKTHETWLDLPIFPEQPVGASDRFYVVTDADANRLDMIAYKFYRNVKYWWALAVLNNILNPLEDCPAGTVLRIPQITAFLDKGGLLR